MGDSTQRTPDHHQANLMQGLQRLSRLRREAVVSEIGTCQKRPEIESKRHDVCVCDATFMNELQRLIAKEKLKGYEELMRLATQCQIARDNLGPLEEEGTQADQRWEAEIWKLKEADEAVYEGFKSEFQSAETYAPGPESEESSQYKPPSRHESYSSEHSAVQPALPIQVAGSVESSPALSSVLLYSIKDKKTQMPIYLRIQFFLEYTEMRHLYPRKTAKYGIQYLHK